MLNIEKNKKIYAKLNDKIVTKDKITEDKNAIKNIIDIAKNILIGLKYKSSSLIYCIVLRLSLNIFTLLFPILFE